MFATLFFATLFSFLTLRAVRATEFVVVTPHFTQCAPAHFNWTATKGPYSVAILNASEPCGEAVVDLGEHHDTSITWNVTIAANWNVTIWVEDVEGEETWSGPIVVKSSDDHSCLPSNLLSNNNNGNTESSSSHSPTPAAATPASTASSANAKSSSSSGPGSIGGLKNGGVPSVREIPAPVLLLGTITLAFTLML